MRTLTLLALFLGHSLFADTMGHIASGGNSATIQINNKGADAALLFDSLRVEATGVLSKRKVVQSTSGDLLLVCTSMPFANRDTCNITLKKQATDNVHLDKETGLIRYEGQDGELTEKFPLLFRTEDRKLLIEAGSNGLLIEYQEPS